jgi:hypothetical protein
LWYFLDEDETPDEQIEPENDPPSLSSHVKSLSSLAWSLYEAETTSSVKWVNQRVCCTDTLSNIFRVLREAKEEREGMMEDLKRVSIVLTALAQRVK